MGIKSVELVRSIRDKIFEETKEMTNEVYLAYIQAKSDLLRSETDRAVPGKGRSTRRKVEIVR
jgi:hypothetical protein